MATESPDAAVFRAISKEIERLRQRLVIAEKRVAILELESVNRRLAKVETPLRPRVVKPARRKGADPT